MKYLTIYIVFKETQMRNNFNLPNIENCIVSIIGLGYVGLPLAIEFSKEDKVKEFSKSHKVVGFDINQKRINELSNNFDSTKETSYEDLISAKNLMLSHEEKSLYESDVFIITVPTPVDHANIPDLTAVKAASQCVGRCILKRKENSEKLNLIVSNPIIIYESTVFPV